VSEGPAGLPRAHGAPVLQARIRQAPEDFIVDEIDAFESSGAGEHLLLTVEKRALNTAFVARRIAQWAGVAEAAVGYAGIKDRHALTRQRFTVQLPGREPPPLELLAFEDADTGEALRVLHAVRHARKLPRGALAGNRFALVLREVAGERAAIDARLQALRDRGVPNAFGGQRFGRGGGNTGKALAMFSVHLWAEFTLMQLIVGGVFERHPNLKWVPTEAGWDGPMKCAGMLDFTLGASRGADNRTMGMFGDETTNSLTKLPSEYVKQNLWYGVSVGLGPDQVKMAKELVGVDRIMWGSDYPHEEGSSPQSKIAIRWAFNDVSVDDTRQMLAGNAAEIYKIDLDALVPIAKEIGPLVSEVHRPITAGDADFDGKIYTADFIPRPFPGGSLLMRGREADAKF